MSEIDHRTSSDRTVAVSCAVSWLAIAAGLTLLAALPRPAEGQSLSPSGGSLGRQIRQARAHDYTYLRTPSDVRRFVANGWLVPVRPSRDVRLVDVSFPYARPAVRTFVQRLGSQYRRACGHPLVVTSLTRPKNRQPRNASPRSVHPTGMALDLRRGQTRSCRRFLDRVLLDLEARGVLEATWERWPPHYHVALFPRPYMAYVEDLRSARSAATVATHRVRRGDSLWGIARRYRTDVERIRAANRLRSSVIRPGQLLKIPAD